MATRMMQETEPPPDSRFIEALTFYQPVLEAFCHANVAHQTDARDVLQKTNLKLWQKSADWNPETEFLPWAFAVARFTVLSHVRDHMRDRLVFDPDVVEAMASDAETFAMELPERQVALSVCLKKLKQEQRDLLHSYYVDGCSLRDIATTHRRSESALKMTMLRLRQTLGSCIQMELGRTGA